MNQSSQLGNVPTEYDYSDDIFLYINIIFFSFACILEKCVFPIFFSKFFSVCLQHVIQKQIFFTLFFVKSLFNDLFIVQAVKMSDLCFFIPNITSVLVDFNPIYYRQIIQRTLIFGYLCI